MASNRTSQSALTNRISQIVARQAQLDARRLRLEARQKHLLKGAELRAKLRLAEGALARHARTLVKQPMRETEVRKSLIGLLPPNAPDALREVVNKLFEAELAKCKQ